MKEVNLQKHLQILLSEPSRVWTTISGKQLQILSPGRANPYEGPDFTDCGVLLDGKIIVGDIEFHKKASDWISHNHSKNLLFKNVIVHMVCINDTLIDTKFETIVIDEKEIENISTHANYDRNEIINQILDLQHYALVRILRKSAEIMQYIENKQIEEALILATKDFLQNYSKKRRRPIYNHHKLDEILLLIDNSLIVPFLYKIRNNEVNDVFASLIDLMKTKISSEGAALRREIILNVVLPLAICLADDQTRINLLTWYWSTPSLNQYGNLKRHFPFIEQKYLWQQQGMLEYLRNKKSLADYPPNPLSSYNFADVLNFYSIGLIQ